MPSDSSETLLFAARRLFVGLAACLAARHAGIEHFVLRIEHEDAPATPLAIRLGSASRDEARFMLLAREHLARLELGQPATALALEADEIHPQPGASASLFGDTRRAAEERQLLVQRLRARLGNEAVTGLRAGGRPPPGARLADRRTRHGRPVFPTVFRRAPCGCWPIRNGWKYATPNPAGTARCNCWRGRSASRRAGGMTPRRCATTSSPPRPARRCCGSSANSRRPTTGTCTAGSRKSGPQRGRLMHGNRFTS
ncbi:MAG: hypothetical protein MZW92_25220 [Comamonadaceae bacterium]|nr:hypothetical protein [Comamonadaceae bacterium]